MDRRLNSSSHHCNRSCLSFVFSATPPSRNSLHSPQLSQLASNVECRKDSKGMDLVFFLEEETRSSFIRSVVRLLHWRYICLWSYQHYLPKCLLFMDGWYEDETNAEAASTSAGSFGRQLFESYRGSICPTENGVPGLVSTERTAYLAVAQENLHGMASTELQRRFYQVAGIKTAVFMACESGVIELGTSTINFLRASDVRKLSEEAAEKTYNDNFQMEDTMNLFAEDIIRQFQSGHNPPHIQAQSWGSSSSRSISLDSPAGSVSQAIMNFPTPSNLQEPTIRNSATSFPASKNTNDPQPYDSSNVPPPNFGHSDAPMMQALDEVLSSSRASSFPAPAPSLQTISRRSAFRRYTPTLSRSSFKHKSISRSQNLMKLAIAVLRLINQRRMESEMRENRPTSSQTSHVISERKRREKLNESFEVLRALLPPGSKKDKASVLAKTRQYITSLETELSQLKDSNRVLEAQGGGVHEPKKLSGGQIRRKEPLSSPSSASSCEGREITITESTTTDERTVEIKVRIKRIELMDLLLRILECIKNMSNAELLTVTADQEDHRSFVVLQLKMKGMENWNKWEDVISKAVGE